MKAFKNITALTMVMVTAIFCLAQISPKKAVTVCNGCRQEVKAAIAPDAEDFSLINLLTLKFM